MKTNLHRLLATVLALLSFGTLSLAQDFTPPLTTPDGFAVPQPGRTFTFPRDHGSHDGFKIEWWYVTGHLRSADGRDFGFQLTFFRNLGPDPKPASPANPAFAHAPIHLGHCALLDARNGRFLHQSRINREGWDARADATTLDVRNGNWSLAFVPGSTNRIRLAGAVQAEASLNLELVPTKPLVAFGTNGVSSKAAHPTAASHYLTFTRLQASGTVRLGSDSIPVTGVAWMDHEFSSSQLEPGQAGWDWACLQLDDGTEAMAYRMRRDDGSTDPFSTFAWIGQDARPRHFGPDRFRWEPIGHWTSPLTGAKYPNRVRITAPSPDGGPDRILEIEPLYDAQELADPLGGVAYWEGACRVKDAQGRPLGRAYLELTGYIGNLQEKFK
jgi:predicted secreted hydrolase